jgi:hypothetical protein
VRGFYIETVPLTNEVRPPGITGHEQLNDVITVYAKEIINVMEL